MILWKGIGKNLHSTDAVVEGSNLGRGSYESWGYANWFP